MKKENGFTMIEVMVAMTVLLVGVLGVMSMQYSAVIGNTTTRAVRVATNLSTGMIEQLQGTPFNNLANGFDTPYSYTDNASTIATTGGVVFTRRWWVVPSCFQLAPNANLCVAAPAPACVPGSVATPVTAVRVRTCWTDKNGTNRSVQVDTIKVNI